MKHLATAAILAASICASGGAIGQERLAIGSTASSSSHYAYYVAASQAINADAEGIETNVVETGATLDNLRRLQRGQVDMGLVTTNVAYDVYHGEGDFEGRAYGGLVLWVYGVSIQNVVVREDSGIEALADLEGARFNPGIVGSGTEATAQAVFSALEIAPDYARGSTGDIVDQIKDNRVAGYVKSSAGRKLDASSVDISTFTPINVVGLTDAQADTIRSELPSLSVVSVNDDEAASGIPAYQTWAYATTTMARPDLDEETAYRVTKAIVEDNELQSAAFAGLKGSDIPQMTMSLATTPLHPGAIRYYEEIGVTVPDHLKSGQ
ncbi:TAXI family TRAP transporter solute-binding subunit [Roseovarius sp. MMSF_3281]|uniref:TAXI family TRAP transporter solute-binding subunit n=1 Tax=Roseovarius sp. MMSF_3281 TaxID=3046694 RepID=UPI00273D0EFE|nr:TAXI family TRAP transporter solute-binding subunit [Roseovarius sp. MMSF_3281]